MVKREKKLYFVILLAFALLINSIPFTSYASKVGAKPNREEISSAMEEGKKLLASYEDKIEKYKVENPESIKLSEKVEKNQIPDIKTYSDDKIIDLNADKALQKEGYIKVSVDLSKSDNISGNSIKLLLQNGLELVDEYYSQAKISDIEKLIKNIKDLESKIEKTDDKSVANKELNNYLFQIELLKIEDASWSLAEEKIEKNDAKTKNILKENENFYSLNLTNKGERDRKINLIFKVCDHRLFKGNLIGLKLVNNGEDCYQVIDTDALGDVDGSLVDKPDNQEKTLAIKKDESQGIDDTTNESIAKEDAGQEDSANDGIPKEEVAKVDTSEEELDEEDSKFVEPPMDLTHENPLKSLVELPEDKGAKIRELQEKAKLREKEYSERNIQTTASSYPVDSNAFDRDNNISKNNLGLTEFEALGGKPFSAIDGGYFDGSIIVKKTDSDTDEPLDGAKFVLKKIGGSYEKTKKSDEDGEIYYKGLKEGTYTLEEISAPKGYEKSNVRWVINVDNSGGVGKPSFESGGKHNGSVEDVSKKLKGDITSKVINRRSPGGDDVVDRFDGPNGDPQKVEYRADLRINHVNPGDYFTVKMNPESDLNSIGVATNFNIESDDGKLIAVGVYDEKAKTIKYVFTSYVANKKDIRFYFTCRDYIDQNKVIKSGTSVKMFMKIGKIENSKTRKVLYNNKVAKTQYDDASVIAGFELVDFPANKFTHVSYVNTHAKSRAKCPTQLKIEALNGNAMHLSQSDVEIYKYYGDVDSMYPDQVRKHGTKVYSIKPRIGSNGNVKIDFPDSGTYAVIVSGKVDKADLTLSLKSTVYSCDSWAATIDYLIPEPRLSGGKANGTVTKKGKPYVINIQNKKDTRGGGNKFIFKKIDDLTSSEVQNTEFTLYRVDKSGKEHKVKTALSDRRKNWLLPESEYTEEERLSWVLDLPNAGIVTFDNLKPGEYVIRETRTTLGHEKSKEYIELRVSKDGIKYRMSNSADRKFIDFKMPRTHKSDVNPFQYYYRRELIYFKNERISDFFIYKVNSKGDPLKGAVFNLNKIDIEFKDLEKFERNPEKNYEEKFYKSATSGSDGKVFFKNLPNGAYRLREAKPPVGYKKTDVYFDISVSRKRIYMRRSDGNVSQVAVGFNDLLTDMSYLNIKNEALGDFKIKKVDNKDNPLKGAEFTLYRWDNSSREKIESKESNKKGILTFKDLKPGSYTIEETKGLEGYKKSDAFISIDVAKDGSIRYRRSDWPLKEDGEQNFKYYSEEDYKKGIKFENTPFFEFKIFKVNEKDRPLKGAKFNLYKLSEDDKWVFIKDDTSDKYGTVYFTDLKEDALYKVKEVKAPDGYLTPDDNDYYYLDTKKYLTYRHSSWDKYKTYKDEMNVYGIKVKNELEKEKLVDISLRKFSPDDGGKAYLEDAEFVLYKAINNDGVYKDKDKAKVTKYTCKTNELGKGVFKGVESGLYWIKETKAPKGFIKSNELYGPLLVENEKVYKVKLLDSGKLDNTREEISKEKGEFFFGEIENFRPTYPTTGGIGKDVFIGSGLALMVTSLVYLEFFKRKERLKFKAINKRKRR